MIRGKRYKKTNGTDEQGAVTVFLAVIVAAVFFFHAVLVDFARVKMAEAEAQAAVQSALRSVLSAYDGELLQYGLFALKDERQAERIFAEVLDAQLNSAADSGNLVNVSWDAATLQLEHHLPLSEHNVIKQQILQEMKYQAPIEFMFLVWDALQKTEVAEDIAEASYIYDRAEMLEELRLKRDRHLDLAWAETEVLTKPNGLLASMAQKYERRLGELESLAKEIGTYQLDEVRQKMDENRERRKRLEKDLDASDDLEERAWIRDSIRKLKERYEELKQLMEKILKFSKLIEEMKKWQAEDYQQILRIQESIHGRLSAAKQVNQELKELIDGQLSQQREGISADNYEQMLRQMIVLDPSYFYVYESELGKIAALFSGFLQLVQDRSTDSAGSYVKYYGELKQANRQYAERGLQFFQRQQPLEKARMEANKDIEQQKEKQQETIFQMLEEVRTFVAACRDEADWDAYLRLHGNRLSNQEGLFAKYARLNDKSFGDSGEGETDMWDHPGRVGKASLRLAEKMKTALFHIRDQAYLHEYALGKFNYRTSFAEGSAGARESHVLSGQEAEYILFGFPGCTLNQGAAFAEIFLIRLAIHVMEQLAAPKNAVLQSGSPLLWLLVATANGAVLAAKDMKELVDGKAVRLSPRFAQIKLTYKDYLRLLYIIHHDEDNMLSRMQALIELNTGIDLTARPTEVQASLSANVRLWFVPLAARLTGQQMKGREAIWQNTACMSY